MSQANQQIDPVQALHGDCLRYPGGITALARIIGRSAGHLHNKFADSMSAYEITDREADALAARVREKTGGNAYIEAKCALHGGLFVPWPVTGEAGDDDVLQALLDSMQHLGQMARDVSEAKADGIVTPAEYRDIESSGRQLMGQIQSFLQVLRTQVRELPDTTPVRAVK